MPYAYKIRTEKKMKFKSTKNGKLYPHMRRHQANERQVDLELFKKSFEKRHKRNMTKEEYEVFRAAYSVGYREGRKRHSVLSTASTKGVKMKSTKKLKEEIEAMKFELRLKDKVDGRNARYNPNIKLIEAQLLGRKEGIQIAEKLVDECRKWDEEEDYWVDEKELKAKLKKARSEK